MKHAIRVALLVAIVFDVLHHVRELRQQPRGVESMPITAGTESARSSTFTFATDSNTGFYVVCLGADELMGQVVTNQRPTCAVARAGNSVVWTRVVP